MWTAFSKHCQQDGVENDREKYAMLILKTQICVNAILDSARKGGIEVKVEEVVDEVVEEVKDEIIAKNKKEQEFLDGIEDK